MTARSGVTTESPTCCHVACLATAAASAGDVPNVRSYGRNARSITDSISQRERASERRSVLNVLLLPTCGRPMLQMAPASAHEYSECHYYTYVPSATLHPSMGLGRRVLPTMERTRRQLARGGRKSIGVAYLATNLDRRVFGASRPAFAQRPTNAIPRLSTKLPEQYMGYRDHVMVCYLLLQITNHDRIIMEN